MDVHKEHSHKSHKPVKNRYRVPPVLLSRMTMKMDRHALRKLLRRFYFLSLAAAFLLGNEGAAWAETAVAQSGSSATKMVSKETTTAAAKKAEPVKKAAKKEEKAAPKKKEYQLADLSEEDKKLEGQVKRQKGTVSGVGTSGIAVEYFFDAKTGESKEIWLPFHKKVEFKGYKKYSEIQTGDTVSVAYKEASDKSKRILQQVTLVAKKPKEEPASAKAEEEETDEDSGA